MFAMLEDLHIRPSLVLAHSDPVYAATVGRAFCQLGWDVYQAHTGPEARRLAFNVRAELVVLDVDLPDESGWLTCAKLTEELPGTRALLVYRHAEKADPEFARFVGAAGLYPAAAGAEPLLNQAREIDPAWIG